MDKDELKKAFSTRLRKWIRENGLSYVRLAEITDVAQSTVVKWARGDMLPRGYELRRLCEATKLSADYLLALTDEMGL